MEEKEILENLLLCVKGECDLYLHGAIESATPAVHEAFVGALMDALSMQNEIYGVMAKKGWYPATTAEAKEICAVKQKYAQQA